MRQFNAKNDGAQISPIFFVTCSHTLYLFMAKWIVAVRARITHRATLCSSLSESDEKDETERGEGGGG